MSSPIDGAPELFEQVARLAGEYVETLADPDQTVTHPHTPEELARILELSLPTRGRPVESLERDMRAILDYSVRTGHPRFMNQLFGGISPPAVVGEWLSALINTSMYTYEAAPVATLMEVELIAKLCRMVGFEAGEGLFAPGGSISNLMAVLAARHWAFPHAKVEGLKSEDRPLLLTSSESHYSLRRAAAVGGMGMDAAWEVETDEVGRMRPEALERAIETALKEGRHPFLVAATAGTTVAGAFDPIEPITEIARRHGMWLHVDASYGGSVLFSERHRHLLAGIERADSVAWNPHKMMGVPLACCATLMRKRGRLEATHGMNADYLFHEGEDASWDLGDMSLQCGRHVDALKLWLAWQVTGDEGYSRRIDRLFELAAGFRDLVVARDGFHLVREPQGANVCFRYLPPGERHAVGVERTRREHEATIRIRERLTREGRFLMNYATLEGAATLRLVANNPLATPADHEALLEAIEALA